MRPDKPEPEGGKRRGKVPEHNRLEGFPRHELHLPTPQETIGVLSEYAESLQVSGKPARDLVKLELFRFLVGGMRNIPEADRQMAETLNAKRMRIVDQLNIANANGRINVQEALKIFEDLHNQLSEHREFLAQELQLDGGALSELEAALDSELAVCRAAAELRESGPGVVLKARENNLRVILLQFAAHANAMLIMRAVGGRGPLEILNRHIVRVMTEYVNPNFPESPEDLSGQFRRKI
ncbi:MAG: hypothetical protein HY394_05610 [Candidatus Diapherotrites archaeon]|nr:hypothetical protein [Candidatus Diapherotrites archaeon]